MKIVIVEDETGTRQGLKKIIEKYTPHTVAASEADGKAGLEAVKRYKPDTVITDIRMPGMDGLAMLHEIRELGLGTRAVLLTGYSDFEYARKSLRLGADEYLLKPLSVEDIIEVLDKVESRLTKAERETVSEEQLLFSLLTGTQEDCGEYARRLEQRLHLHIGEPVSLFLLRNDSMLCETSNEMKAVLEEVLPAVCLTNYHIFRLPGRRMVLVMIMDGQSVHYMKELFAMRVLPAVREIGDCMISFEEIRGLSELKDRVGEMEQSFEYGFLTERPGILDREFTETCRFDMFPYPDQLEQMLRRELRSGAREKTAAVSEGFVRQVLESCLRPDYCREYTLRFLLAALQGAREIRDCGEMDALSHSLLDKIMNCSTREKLLYEYRKVMEFLLAERGGNAGTENGIVLNVIEFIRNNYARDISLTEAAQVVGITPEYLSRLFAREMGIHFSTFLGDFRISAAKRMLLENRYRIYEIAEAVGYKDTKYFNKVFKSVVGLSPSEYKKAK